MNDEAKTDAEKTLAHVDEVIQSDGLKAAGWVKMHIAWIIGLGCLLLGFIMGHLQGHLHP